MDSFDPASVMAAVDSGARQLDSAGRALGKAIKNLSEAEAEYERHFEEALIGLVHRYKENGERLPGEDLRRALAHQNLAPDTYAKYLSAKAEVRALEAWVRTLQAATSARQSLLSTLRAEATVT
jgi:hypothetical protein